MGRQFRVLAFLWVAVFCSAVIRAQAPGNNSNSGEPTTVAAPAASAATGSGTTSTAVPSTTSTATTPAPVPVPSVAATEGKADPGTTAKVTPTQAASTSTGGAVTNPQVPRDVQPKGDCATILKGANLDSKMETVLLMNQNAATLCDRKDSIATLSQSCSTSSPVSDANTRAASMVAGWSYLASHVCPAGTIKASIPCNDNLKAAVKSCSSTSALSSAASAEYFSDLIQNNMMADGSSCKNLTAAKGCIMARKMDDCTVENKNIEALMDAMLSPCKTSSGASLPVVGGVTSGPQSSSGTPDLITTTPASTAAAGSTTKPASGGSSGNLVQSSMLMVALWPLLLVFKLY